MKKLEKRYIDRRDVKALTKQIASFFGGNVCKQKIPKSSKNEKRDYFYSIEIPLFDAQEGVSINLAPMSMVYPQFHFEDKYIVHINIWYSSRKDLKRAISLTKHYREYLPYAEYTFEDGSYIFNCTIPKEVVTYLHEVDHYPPSYIDRTEEDVIEYMQRILKDY